ncbi:heterokaryon incompatibility, partial [Cadophora sp. MPI-SDFR-AT-0126]
PIHCELYHSFRADKPYYEALSYAWGDTSDTVPISINGTWSSVAKNLFKALKHIRDDFIDIRLWVNTRCINQDNDTKKSEQVGQIRDIYSDAANTIV